MMHNLILGLFALIMEKNTHKMNLKTIFTNMESNIKQMYLIIQCLKNTYGCLQQNTYRCIKNTCGYVQHIINAEVSTPFKSTIQGKRLLPLKTLISLWILHPSAAYHVISTRTLMSGTSPNLWSATINPSRSA